VNTNSRVALHHGASRSPTFSSSARSTALSKIFRRAPVGVHRWDLTDSLAAKTNHYVYSR
jgi:hypothetical protein